MLFEFPVTGSSNQGVTIPGVCTVATSETITVKLQVKGDGTHSTTFAALLDSAKHWLVYRLWRPIV